MDFSFQDAISKVLHSTGFAAIEPGQGVMIVIALILLYLAIWKKLNSPPSSLLANMLSGR